MNALVQAMVYHLNIVSGTVPVSFTTLAREAGLATHSAAGNESITRATRRIWPRLVSFPISCCGIR